MKRSLIQLCEQCYDSIALFKKKFQEQLIKEGHQRNSALARLLEKLQSFLFVVRHGWRSLASRWRGPELCQTDNEEAKCLERMTKQDEQTKHLKDASRMLSPYEVVADALSCCYK